LLIVIVYYCRFLI